LQGIEFNEVVALADPIPDMLDSFLPIFTAGNRIPAKRGNLKHILPPLSLTETLHASFKLSNPAPTAKPRRSIEIQTLVFSKPEAWGITPYEDSKSLGQGHAKSMKGAVLSRLGRCIGTVSLMD